MNTTSILLGYSFIRLFLERIITKFQKKKIQIKITPFKFFNLKTFFLIHSNFVVAKTDLPNNIKKNTTQ